MKKKKKERSIETVILENSPDNQVLARLLKQISKEKEEKE